MSLIRAYHAGDAWTIQSHLTTGAGLTESQASNNWLVRGVYFWENDPKRAEKWQADHNKGMILECLLETELMIDLLIDDQRSRSFKGQAIDSVNSLINSKAPRSSRENECFDLDGQLVDRLRPKLQSYGYAGIRIAFCLDQPILPDGNPLPSPADPDLFVGLLGHPRASPLHPRLARMNGVAAVPLPSLWLWLVSQMFKQHADLMCWIRTALNRPSLKFRLDLRASEQEILQGIEELEGRLR